MVRFPKVGATADRIFVSPKRAGVAKPIARIYIMINMLRDSTAIVSGVPYICRDHHIVICPIRSSTDASGHEAHNDCDAAHKKTYGVSRGGRGFSALVDMC